MTDSPAAAPSESPAKPFWQRWWFVAIGALAILVTVVAALGTPDEPSAAPVIAADATTTDAPQTSTTHTVETAPTDAQECGTSEWPPFMMYLRDRRLGGNGLGFILWCNEDQWTFHAAVPFTEERETRHAGMADQVFPWFGPGLTTQQAWDRLTGSIPHRTVEATHYEAVLGLVGETPDGKYRMEFTSEGIPVRIVVPGDDGFRMWGHFDWADRPMRSDEDLFHWPICDAGNNQGQPCWSPEGEIRNVEDPCQDSFGELAQSPYGMGCSI